MNKNPWHRNRLIRDGIYKALYEEMVARPEIYILGEGAHMKIHFDAPVIEKEMPARVITLPISEDGNSNFAVGMSLAGLVPVVDVISSDFLYRTMDAICNTMAKSGTVGDKRTMIVRSEFMTGGPTSGQRIEALFAHVPGLRVAIPSNPVDAYVLMKEALRLKEVTIFFEDRMIEDEEMPEVYKNGSYQAAREGFASIVRQGTRATIVSYGLTQRYVEDALFHKDVTIIDLRTLYPLDIDTVIHEALKSGKLLVVEPDVGFLGIGAEILAQVAEKCAHPPSMLRIAGPRITIPANRDQHDLIVPSKNDILEALEILAP